VFRKLSASSITISPTTILCSSSILWNYPEWFPWSHFCGYRRSGVGVRDECFHFNEFGFREIFERNTPFGGMADMIVINQILAGIRPEFENTPLEFRAVIGKAWGDDAKSRPSAAQMACVLSN
jgi:hypothetical protein